MNYSIISKKRLNKKRATAFSLLHYR